jgi:hypothetical protein
MGRSYSEVDTYTISHDLGVHACRISGTETNQTRYSEFNMGTGESSALGLLQTLENVPDGSLVAIEEIEAGLHPAALIALSSSLRATVSRKRLQCIVSSHSPVFIESVPPESRILLQRLPQQEVVLASNDVTVEAATSDLTGQAQVTDVVLCEDGMAADVIRCLLSQTPGANGFDVVPFGDKNAVMDSFFTLHVAGARRSITAILDGDAALADAQVLYNRRLTECPRAHAPPWSEVEGHVTVLPGHMAPEAWLLSLLNTQGKQDELVNQLGADRGILLPALNEARDRVLRSRATRRVVHDAWYELLRAIYPSGTGDRDADRREQVKVIEAILDVCPQERDQTCRILMDAITGAALPTDT